MSRGKLYTEIFKLNPKVILEVGAYDFHDSKILKDQFPNADVYAVEADPVNYERHNESAKKHDIKTFHFAMSDTNGIIKFYPSTIETKKDIEWRVAGSIMKPLLKNGTNEGINHSVLFDMEGVDVPTKRFDDFCSEIDVDQIDFLFMDVEGAEYKVVNSFGDFRPKLIFAETAHYKLKSYDNDMNIDEFDNLMESLGYRIIERLEWDTLYKHQDA